MAIHIIIPTFAIMNKSKSNDFKHVTLITVKLITKQKKIQEMKIVTLITKQNGLCESPRSMLYCQLYVLYLIADVNLITND